MPKTYETDVVEMTLMRVWGSSVSRRRRDLGLSQAKLASLAGVTQQTISRIETGTAFPTDTTKLRIALGLRSQPGRLFRWPDESDYESTAVEARG